MRANLLIAVGAAILAATSPAQRPEARYQDHRLVRTFVGSPHDLETLHGLGAVTLNCVPGPGQVDCIVPPGAMEALEASGLPYVVRHIDVQAIVDAEAQRTQQQGAVAGTDPCDDTWFTDFKPMESIDARLDELAAAHPDVAQVVVVGNSIEGRTIRGLRITAPGGGSRPAVLINGCQHAREWIAPMMPMYVAAQLLCGWESDPQIQALLEQIEFLVVPVVNPDGYVYTWPPGDRFWRKNRRNNLDGSFGVDLNRNWSVGWGGPGASSDPSSGVYHGTDPFSEPESAALRDFIVANPSIVAAIDFHSYGQYVLWPWGYTFTPPPQAEVFAQLGTGMEAAIESVYGLDYTAGPVAPTLYQASGVSIDWAFGDQGIYAVTVELRDTGQGGFVLPPEQILATCQENLAGVLAMAEWSLQGVMISFPEGLPDFVDAELPATVAVEIATTTAGPLVAGSERVLARVGDAGAYQPLKLTHVEGNLYQADLPAAPCGALVHYYFEVDSQQGTTYRSPADAPAIVHETQAVTLITHFADDFEADLGWTVQNGAGLTDGAWDLGVPAGGGDRGDPAADGDGSASCYLTDNVDGNSDVDGGTTTLRSPLLDASDPEAWVGYWRWYSNDFGDNPNSDVMPIEISNDGGSSWTTLETVSENAGAWVRKEFRVADFVAPSGAVRLRFVAGDLGAGSVVEAGIDGVEVFSVGCATVTGDVTGDGVVDVVDLVALVTTWGPCLGCSADLNGDGVVDVQDLVILVTNWS